jgi:hypothetical protein
MENRRSDEDVRVDWQDENAERVHGLTIEHADPSTEAWVAEHAGYVRVTHEGWEALVRDLARNRLESVRVELPGD